ncbi:MAG: CHAP domain-containing protein [Treponema sp.]
MDLQEFVKYYDHSLVDYDKHYGAQCVDLFRQYCKDVLNIPHTGGVVGASDLYTKYDILPLEQKYFEKIPCQKGMVPNSGDVVIFSPTRSNQYGHVAIVVKADGDSLTVFEQDGIKQTGAKIATWNYERVLGFLRKREDA